VALAAAIPLRRLSILSTSEPDVSAELLTTAARLGLIASRATLSDIINWLLPLLNTDPHQPPLRYPSIRLISEIIGKAGSTVFSGKGDYTRSLTQALRALLQDSGSLFDCFNGFELNRDVIARQPRHYCIDVSIIPDYLRHLITDLLFNQVFMPRVATGHKPGRTDVLFILDESDLLLSQASEDAFPDGFSPAGLVARESRELGIGAAIGVSALQNIGEQFMKDCCFKMIYSLSDPKSVWIARKALQIDPRCDRLISSLKPGQCIYQESQSDWPFAMWCKTDYIAPAGNQDPIEYDDHPFIPAKSLDEMPHVLEAIEQRKQENRRSNLRQREIKRATKSDKAKDLLTLAAMNIFVPVRQLFEQLNITSGSARTRIQNKLKKEGLADFHVIHHGRSKELFCEPTETGWKLLDKDTPKGQGGGSFEHRYLIHRVKAARESQGHAVTVEDLVPKTNHRADLLVQENNRLVAVECVAECTANLPSHIHACFVESDAVDELVIVAATKTELAQIRNGLKDQLVFMPCADRIKFETIE